jgi:hypothetical protein
MKLLLRALFMVTSIAIALLPRQVAAVEVTLLLRNIATDDFIEWRLKPSQGFTKSTGKLGRDSAEFEQTWEVGEPGGKILFWWAHLNGEADATVLVNNFVVFQGHCSHLGKGKVRMIDTCSYPRVYKTGGGGPYLVDRPESETTRVGFATSMLLDRFSGAECLSANLLVGGVLPRN